MASNFPLSLDSFTNPSSTDAMDSVSVPHATQHSDLNDAVEALQAKVGADSSAVASSLDYKVAQLEASNGVYFAKALRNTDLTLNSTGTSVIDSSLNLTVDAAVGDVISYTFDTVVASGTNIAHFMPYTLDGVGALVNPVADMGTTFNPAIWQTPENSCKSFTWFYEVVAGDIVSNQVTVGLTVKTAGVSRQIVYGTVGMRVYLANLGSGL